MIARSLIAGAAVVTLMVGATFAAAAGPDAKAAKARKEMTDHEGNKLSLDLGDAGKVRSAAATDRHGKPLRVRELAMKDTRVCIPRTAGAKGAEPLCQPLAFVSEEAIIKMGTATCTCRMYTGILFCYGDTCD